MRLLVKILRWEATIYGSILRWIFRRPAVPEGATPFAYVGAVGVLMWGFIIASAMELVALHLILHGVWRLAADIVSVWGLVWMVGLLACYTVGDSAVSEIRLFTDDPKALVAHG